MRRRPNLFFVGHPRSGSGTIYGWLQRHPDVFMARKELHYFGEDVGFNAPRRTIGNYLRHFDGAGPRRWVGDASTWYLASTEAAEQIGAFSADARVVISLREPSSFLESLHAHLHANGDEDLPTLAEGLAAEAARRSGRDVPRGSLPVIALRYREHCAYATQVERYLRVFGRERVHVVLFDDLVADPQRTYRELFDFLGVALDPPAPESARRQRRRRNAAWGVRSRSLQRLLKQPLCQQVYMGLRAEPLPGVSLAIRALRRLNAVPAKSTVVEDAVRAQVRAATLPEVERLESLLGRDLSGWKHEAMRAGGLPVAR
jgi:hypothetical protein